MKKTYLLFLLTMFAISTVNAQKSWLYRPGVAENYPGVIRSTDANAFKELNYLGQESTKMFDRRVKGRITVNAHVFKVLWADSGTMKILVNPETSGFKEIKAQAEKHAKIIGLLPYCLRSFIDKIDLHMGYGVYGGGSRGLLLYAEKTVEHETKIKKLNEIIVHEAAHNLGGIIGTSPDWVAAQNSDNAFISKYAADNPQREDVSESFLAWLILRYHRNRITDEQAKAISNQIPARLKYFDNANYKMNPVR